MFGDGAFRHPSGRAHFVPVTPRAPVHATCSRFPLVLNTGRVRDQWHTMTRTGLAPRLAEHSPEPFADLDARDAAAAGIADGDLVKVTTWWGSAVLRARTSGQVPRGMLFAPIHWSAANSSSARIGALVNPAVDATSGEPELKHTPATLERFDVAWHGVLFRRASGADPHATRAPDAEWWTLVRGDGIERFEMAGTAAIADLDQWSGALFVPDACSDEAERNQPGDGILDYVDEAAGVYRAARVAGGRLAACVFVSRSRTLPPRDWIASLFAAERLGDTDRMALLAARPLEACADTSALVCSCFHVRESAIRRAIENDGVATVAEIGACLRAGTNCGSCIPELRALIASAGRSLSA